MFHLSVASYRRGPGFSRSYMHSTFVARDLNKSSAGITVAVPDVIHTVEINPIQQSRGPSYVAHGMSFLALTTNSPSFFTSNRKRTSSKGFRLDFWETL